METVCALPHAMSPSGITMPGGSSPAAIDGARSTEANDPGRCRPMKATKARMTRRCPTDEGDSDEGYGDDDGGERLQGANQARSSERRRRREEVSVARLRDPERSLDRARSANARRRDSLPSRSPLFSPPALLSLCSVSLSLSLLSLTSLSLPHASLQVELRTFRTFRAH